VNPDYISVGNNGAAQSVASSGTDIIFDTNIASSGIGYNTGTGVFTLTAGKTYRITSEISFQNYSTNGYVLVQLVDGSSNTQINTQTNTYPYNSGFNEVNNLVSDIIYTPNTNQTVKFRVTGGTPGITAEHRGAGFSRAVIQQINPTIAVQATATGTTNTNFIKYTRTASQSVSANSVIICNVLESSSGTAVSVNTGTGQVTLTAGTYRLRGTAGTIVSSLAASFIGYGWYNETSSDWIGEGAQIISPSSTNFNTSNSGTAEAVITVASTTVVSLRVISASNIGSIGGNQSDFAGTYANPWIDIEQIGSTFALTNIGTLATTGDVSVGGNLTVGASGGNVSTKVTGSWTLTTGANTVSFTVTAGESYVMWVNGNIPSGIVNWNATVTLSNNNVPAIGVQYGWYYLAGNALVLTSIPNQIVGTSGTISTSSPAVSNSNTFTFGITNNSGASQIVYYGYIKVS
jgi:hypothetical protein